MSASGRRIGVLGCSIDKIYPPMVHTEESISQTTHHPELISAPILLFYRVPQLQPFYHSTIQSSSLHPFYCTLYTLHTSHQPIKLKVTHKSFYSNLCYSVLRFSTVPVKYPYVTVVLPPGHFPSETTTRTAIILFCLWSPCTGLRRDYSTILSLTDPHAVLKSVHMYLLFPFQMVGWVLWCLWTLIQP